MMEIGSNISVVIATLNEEEGIGPTIDEMQKVLKNAYLVVVDGNSVDRTIEIAKNMGADVLLQEGKGKGDAMFQGFKQLGTKVPYVVFTDADYTYPAEYVPGMIEVLSKNPKVGMVIGNRFKGELNHSKSVTNPFYLGNKLFAFAQLVMNGVNLGDPLSGLRVVRSEILEGWKPKSKGFDVEAEMNALVRRKGYRTVEVPIDYRDRMGEKKLKLRHGLGIMKRIFAESLE
ncbi:MAG: glycosyltransferase family 2 protein [Chloroflexi bacterium]|nr:glycosyltransferase family 2 protein [Chloroflexota bacterium]